jgi:hypothetical protein
MPEKPLAVLVGYIGKLPVAGMALYNLHYVVGLQELGYQVHYVERLNSSSECYDPNADAWVDDPGFALRWLAENLKPVLSPGDRWSFIDRDDTCHGTSWNDLLASIDRAEFVLTIEDATWFDELERCPHRAFLDGDPVFTQARMLDAESQVARTLARYPVLFTYCMRMGEPDCPVPDLGRDWIPTRPAVATALWDWQLGDVASPVTTVMNWGAWGEVELDGRSYGHKNREFARLIDLPSRTSRRIEPAIGGPAPREELEAKGWTLGDPLRATGTIDAYRAYIAGSSAELGIAKHAYVASRCGWFSDRSTCYLAGGRPVLHQDTGFTDWLPDGDGVLAFSDMDGLLEGLDRLDADYPRHARAARRVAEEHFEARTVIGEMLDQAGFR